MRASGARHGRCDGAPRQGPRAVRVKTMAVLGLAVGLTSGCPDKVTRSVATGTVASQGSTTGASSLLPAVGSSPSAAPSPAPDAPPSPSLQVTLDGPILPTPAGAPGPEATP